MLKGTVKDIFFDLDHTLWDFDRNSALAFKRVFASHKIKMKVEEFLEAYEPINELYWKQFREELISKEELRRGRLMEAFRGFKMEFPLETIDLLAESYIKELPGDNHLFPNAVEVLKYLRSKYNLHIITNGFKEVQFLKLENSGIRNYFATITTSEEVGVKKPHKLIFEAALDKAKTKSFSSLMIGDNLEADIEGAKAAGMKTLHFNYKNDENLYSEFSFQELNMLRKLL